LGSFSIHPSIWSAAAAAAVIIYSLPLLLRSAAIIHPARSPDSHSFLSSFSQTTADVICFPFSVFLPFPFIAFNVTAASWDWLSDSNVREFF
jgi:hypothetical protein